MQVSTNLRAWERGRQVTLAGAALALVAAFMPWVSVFVISVTGFDGGDGKITALCGLVGIVLALAWWSNRRAHSTVQILLAAGVTLVGLNDLTNYAAIGLYLTILAGVAWLVGAVMMLRAHSPAGAPAADPPTGSQ